LLACFASMLVHPAPSAASLTQHECPSVPRAAGQGLTWFSDDQTEQRDMLARWTVAFGLATMAHLRNDCNLEQDLQVGADPLRTPPLPALRDRCGLAEQCLLRQYAARKGWECPPFWGACSCTL